MPPSITPTTRLFPISVFCGLIAGQQPVGEQISASAPGRLPIQNLADQISPAFLFSAGSLEKLVSPNTAGTEAFTLLPT